MHNSGKRQITLVAIGVLLLFFLLLGLSLSSRGWLNISAPDKLPDNKEVLVQLSSDDGANSQTITLAAGESKRLWLNKGSWQVTGTAGNVKSIDVVRVKGFSTTQVLTPTGEARQLQQLGSDVGNCITNPAGKLFSYGCESGAQVVASDVSGNYISRN